MSGLEELIEKAKDLKSKGLTTEEIADILNVQTDTATWLVVKAEKGVRRAEPKDVYVDWSTIGRDPGRVELMGIMLANLVDEAMADGTIEEPDMIAGVDADGGPLAAIIARELEKPLAIIRWRYSAEGKKDEQHLSVVDSNFGDVYGKKILLVDDVITSGIMINEISNASKKTNTRVVGAIVIANKTGTDEIDGVPLRCVIKVTAI
ncbi:MAG: orotate phosphoribosyltransferase-like protein [Promethearchaeota archaeon]